MEWSILFFFNSVLLGIGLAMDAFSVSLANGLNEAGMKKSKMFCIAGVFAHRAWCRADTKEREDLLHQDHH